MKQYNFEDYFSSLAIPETWATLDEFIEWFMDSRMPWMIPEDSEVYRTDNASSIILFRHDRYQVELYVNDPLSKVSLHGHPGLDLSIMQMGRMNPILWGNAGKVLKSGRKHDGNFGSEKGTVYLTFEKWVPGIPMTSASVQWSGTTVGPIHDELIKRHFPNAEIIDGVSNLTIEMVQGQIVMSKLKNHGTL
jgi:hypothetical protein